MFLEDEGVIFPIPEQKEGDGSKSIIINFFKSLGQKAFKSFSLIKKIPRACKLVVRVYGL